MRANPGLKAATPLGLLADGICKNAFHGLVGFNACMHAAQMLAASILYSQ